MLRRTRRVFLIPLCALLGIATTVSVAWAFALLRTGPLTGAGDVGWIKTDQEGEAIIARRSRTGIVVQWVPIALFSRSGEQAARARDSLSDTSWTSGELRESPPSITWGALERSTRALFARAQCACGWPLPALWSDVPGLSKGLVLPVDVHLAINMEPAFRSRQLPTLPARPIWAYFILDSTFYLALWLALFVAAPALHRSRRRRRGQCEYCAYDLRDSSSPLCPECGCAAVTHSTPAAKVD